MITLNITNYVLREVTQKCTVMTVFRALECAVCDMYRKYYVIRVLYRGPTAEIGQKGSEIRICAIIV